MTRRLSVVGLIGWLMVIGAGGMAEGANNTLATAVQAVPGHKQSQTFAASEVRYYGYVLHANRSYAVFCWPGSLESSTSLGGSCQLDLRNLSDTVVATGGVWNLEPFPKAGAVAVFTPTSTNGYFARVWNYLGGASATVHVIVIETTLASPWYFVSPANGYESYVEIRNHTENSRSVTVRAYSSTGTVAGSTTVSVPANGNTFVRVGADLGVAGGSGSVTITHDGMPGAIVANTTALSGTTGLSFDAPFTPRMVWSIF